MCVLCVCECVCVCVCGVRCARLQWVYLSQLMPSGWVVGILGSKMIPENKVLSDKGWSRDYIVPETLKPLGDIVCNFSIQNFSRFLGNIGSVLSMNRILTSFSMEVCPGSLKWACTSFCI